MIRRRMLLVTAVLALLLTAWALPHVMEGKDSTGKKSMGGRDSSTGSDIAMQETDGILQGQIIKIYDDYSLVLETGEDGVNGGLYMLPEDVKLSGAETLRAGDMVQIGYNGGIEEIYPASLGNAAYVKLVEHGSTIIQLYEMVFMDLWNTDSGLNEGSQIIAFDLSKAKNLDEGQRQALTYIMGKNIELVSMQSTFDELDRQGYIDKETMTFEKGILFQLEVTDASDQSAAFSAQKWRSGLGAYYFYDCTGTLTKDGWTYEVGDHMIS